MSSSLIELFPTPLCIVDGVSGEGIDNETLLNLKYANQADGNGVLMGNEDILNKPGWEGLKSNILSKVKEFLFGQDTLGVFPTYDVMITTSWPVKVLPDGNGEPHIHPWSQWSGVWYPKEVIDNSGLLFLCPTLKCVPSHLAPPFASATKLNTKEAYCPIKGEQLLIFPSDLIHRIPHNTSEKERCSVAFNVVLNGDYVTPAQSIHVNTEPIAFHKFF